MKKYNLFKLFLISAFSLSILGCNDDDIFNLDPDDTLVSDYYVTEDHFVQAVEGMYMGFFELGYYGGSSAGGDIIIVGDLLADNLIINPSGRQSNGIAHIWGYDSGAPTNIYAASYLLASRSNAILQNLDNLDDLVVLENPNVKAEVRGHALAVRGLAHFEIARHFVKIPTQSSDANSFVGIPYVDVYDPYIQPARLGTVADVYDRIITDLEQALVDIPTPYVQGKLNKTAVRALLSKVYLYKGDYAKVIEYATPVVNSVQPANSASLQGLWRSQNSEGVLFERFVMNNADPAIGVNYSQGVTAAEIIAEYTVDKAFYDTFLPTETQRRDASIQFFASKNIYAVKKYLQSTFGAGIQHGRYLRVEEVILNLAEAQYLSGDQAAALTTLDLLRSKRYTSFAGGESGDLLFDAIMSERRKELCFETGDRWFTFKRLQGVSGIPSTYTQGIVRSGNGHFADGTGTVPSQQTLAPSSPKWQFPMSQTQLIRNPNLTQTPGY